LGRRKSHGRIIGFIIEVVVGCSGKKEHYQQELQVSTDSLRMGKTSAAKSQRK